MESAQDILNEYIGLRGRGMDANAVLYALRFRIEALSIPEQAEMVRVVRTWETNRHNPQSQTLTPKTNPVKPTPPSPAPRVIKPLQQDPGLPGGMVRCEQCAKVNKISDMFCTECGYFLSETASPHQTVRLVDGSVAPGEYFGELSTLVLLIKGTREAFKVRPQQLDHEVVLGRSDGGTLRPDVDLGDYRASNLGVSRMHLSLRYDGKNHTLRAFDMNSSNGSYINGQRLYPGELRVVRHGDELRLGNLTLVVYYHQPEA